jgi:hypothetical protein
MPLGVPGDMIVGALDVRAQILEYQGKYLHQKGGNMTALLEQALAAIEKLPADAQDAIATRLLAEVADEHAWAERFEATTDAQWDRIAASVRQAIAAEELVSLDDVFPPRVRP